MKKLHSLTKNTLKTNLNRNKKRKLSSQIWLKRQLNDIYVHSARAAGYHSRAAYKLIEIDAKYSILKKGVKVVDVGAAPGGWSQVIVNKIFPHVTSKLISVDLLPINEVPYMHGIQGDFTDINVVNEVKTLLDGKANMVLSDMAPNTTGSRSVDHLRIIALVELALQFAFEVLDVGGVFVCKVFQGGTESVLLNEIKKRFKQVDHFKPPASRKESKEIYLVAQGFKG